MEVDHCGNWVTKRNLNLENFLRQLDKDFGFPRYYDTCVLEHKGALTLRHVIVTDTTVFFTGNVPKNVFLSIPFSDIRNIEMVADRKELVKGGKMQHCIYQHIQLQCTSITPFHQTKLVKESTSSGWSLTSTPTSNLTLLSSTRPNSDTSYFSDVSSSQSPYESPIAPPLMVSKISRINTAESTSSSSSSTDHPHVVVGGVQHLSRIRSTRDHRLINWSESGSASEELDYSKKPYLFSSTASLSPQSWTTGRGQEIGGNDKDAKRVRRPRSLDMSQVSRLKTKMMGLIFREDSRTSTVGYDDEDSPSTIQVDDHLDDNRDECVNFYLYRPNSVMLNELFLFWNRHRLKTLLKEDMDEDNDKSYSGVREAEKVFSKLPHLLSNPSSQDLLPRLKTLHRALIKHEQLSRILWKDWEMVMNLLSLLKQCLSSEDREREDETQFINRLSASTFIMDIFRVLLSATGPSWFKGNAANNNDSNNNNNNNALKNNNQKNNNHSKLVEKVENEEKSSSFYFNGRRKIELQSKTTPPNITSLHDLTCNLALLVFSSSSTIFPPTSFCGTRTKEMIIEVVCNPRKFAQGRWLCSTDTKAIIIKAVTLVHNSSVALLHEILSIVHFSSKDKERIKFMSSIQLCPMETYLRLSMTQILNMLWDNQLQLRPSQTAMLFRHVSTAQTLMTHVPSIKTFLTRNFCEEFRYFVHEESAYKKILDRYPLKSTLLVMCEQLRQEIINK